MNGLLQVGDPVTYIGHNAPCGCRRGGPDTGLWAERRGKKAKVVEVLPKAMVGMDVRILIEGEDKAVLVFKEHLDPASPHEMNHR